VNAQASSVATVQALPESPTHLHTTSAYRPLTMSATAPSQTVYSIGYDFHAGTGAAAMTMAMFLEFTITKTPTAIKALLMTR
jgi:hypothetical protein